MNIARVYWLLISATSGAAVLALEVLAARTMAPSLGSGPVAWSALLAVALGMLAVGNLVGGLLSEWVSPWGAIAWSWAAASLGLVALSQYHAPAMQWSAGHSLLVGAAAAALITQAVPLLMLGLVTPVILRQEDIKTGRWAGLVLAAGSGGGIAGALVGGLVLLPELGISRSYLLVAVVLALTALPAAWPQRRWLAALVLAASLAWAAVCWYRCEPGRIIQSQFGQLEVRSVEDTRILLIDGLPQTAVPAQLWPGDGLRHGYLLEAALLMRYRRPAHALVIGLGAGLAPRLLSAYGIDCESVEIDPAVVEIAQTEFGFDGPTTIADGRAFLSQSARRFDLIFLDICTAERLPWHLFTVEAMQCLRDRLSAEGILAIQFIGDDGPWSASVARTVDAVFGESLMLSAEPLGAVGPRWLFAARGYPPRLPQGLFSPAERAPWEIVQMPEGGRLLSDDQFPAELEWARTAIEWRRRYAAALGR